jgi:hypothetical protein
LLWSFLHFVVRNLFALVWLLGGGHVAPRARLCRPPRPSGSQPPFPARCSSSSPASVTTSSSTASPAVECQNSVRAPRILRFAGRTPIWHPTRVGRGRDRGDDRLTLGRARAAASRLRRSTWSIRVARARCGVGGASRRPTGSTMPTPGSAISLQIRRHRVSASHTQIERQPESLDRVDELQGSAEADRVSEPHGLV